MLKKKHITVWRVSKYAVFSGMHFPVFRLKTEKYGPLITLYLDTFHAVHNTAELQKHSYYHMKWKFKSTIGPLKLVQVQKYIKTAIKWIK